MGCHRSGTNLLYDTLLSAGGFAVYRGYLPVHKLLIPRFGRPDKSSNRKKLLETWLRSKGFLRSGLDAAELSAQVMAECRSGGDFIRIVMEAIALSQGVHRWAVYDPDAVLYLPTIKAEIPEALFVHIIRDGRDIALSLKTMEGFRPFPWNRRAGSLVATGLYWAWMVGKGRRYGQLFSDDYFELHYEELVTQPRRTLVALSQFLDQELDYDRIRNTALGRLSESNSSFRGEPRQGQVNPVNRWKERLSARDVSTLEAVIGKSLEQVGYPLTTAQNGRSTGLQDRALRILYRYFLEAKLRLKTKTPLGRFTSLSALELDNSSPQIGHSMAED
jgi:hypothetical protein